MPDGTSGNPFDGNGDGTGGDDIVLTWVYHKGKKITIKEQDGDKIILQLKGPGKLFDIQHNFDAAIRWSLSTGQPGEINPHWPHHPGQAW